MKIIVEEIKRNPFIIEIKTMPYAGVKEARVSLEIEENDNLSSVGNIIKFPYLLYVNDLSNSIGKELENEFVYENLTTFSKKELDEWIKEKLIKR